MVDCVKLVFFNKPYKMRELHRDHPIRFERNLHPVDEVINIRHLRKTLFPRSKSALIPSPANFKMAN